MFIKNFFVVLATIFLVCFFLLGGNFLVDTLLGNQPSFLGYTKTLINDNEMIPYFEKNDYVYVRKLKPDEKLEKGGIYEYKYGDLYIVHTLTEIRIDENGEEYYIFKGNVSENIDPWKVYRKDVINVVIQKQNTFIDFFAFSLIISLCMSCICFKIYFAF